MLAQVLLRVRLVCLFYVLVRTASFASIVFFASKHLSSRLHLTHRIKKFERLNLEE